MAVDSEAGPALELAEVISDFLRTVDGIASWEPRPDGARYADFGLLADGRRFEVGVQQVD